MLGKIFFMSFSPVSPPVVDLRTIMETEESRKKCGATPKSNLGLVKKNQKRKDHMALYFCHEELERSVVSLLSFFCILM
jgi:hypothetical protein